MFNVNYIDIIDQAQIILQYKIKKEIMSHIKYLDNYFNNPYIKYPDNYFEN